MKTLFTTLVLALSTTAFADGFKCEQLDHNINVKVFNNTSAEAGTRNAAVMVFSDASVAYGNKTIASFSSSKRKLGQNGTSYLAVVDLRVSESNRSGENILGTKLGQIKEIYVDINHNYSQPIEAGDETEGTISVVKRNGKISTFDINCVRYLKN
jgi:hypothetical protein